MNRKIITIIFMVLVAIGGISQRAHAGVTGTSLKLAVGAAFGIYAYRKLSTTSLAHGISRAAETVVGKKVAQAAGFALSTSWSLFKAGALCAWDAVPKPVMSWQLDEMEKKLQDLQIQNTSLTTKLSQINQELKRAEAKMQSNVNNQDAVTTDLKMGEQ